VLPANGRLLRNRRFAGPGRARGDLPYPPGAGDV